MCGHLAGAWAPGCGARLVVTACFHVQPVVVADVVRLEVEGGQENLFCRVQIVEGTRLPLPANQGLHYQ